MSIILQPGQTFRKRQRFDPAVESLASASASLITWTSTPDIICLVDGVLDGATPATGLSGTGTATLVEDYPTSGNNTGCDVSIPITSGYAGKQIEVFLGGPTTFGYVSAPVDTIQVGPLPVNVTHYKGEALPAGTATAAQQAAAFVAGFDVASGLPQANATLVSEVAQVTYFSGGVATFTVKGFCPPLNSKIQWLSGSANSGTAVVGTINSDSPDLTITAAVSPVVGDKFIVVQSDVTAALTAAGFSGTTPDTVPERLLKAVGAAATTADTIAPGKKDGLATLAADGTVATDAGLKDMLQDDDETPPKKQFTAKALENGPAPTLVVAPIASTVGTGQVSDGVITVYQHGALKQANGSAFLIPVVDDTGAAVSLAGKTLKFVCHELGATAKLWQVSCTATGTNHNIVSVTDGDTNTQTAGTFRYVVWNTTDDVVVARGALIIEAEVAAT